MIVTLLFSVNPDAAFAVTLLEACPLLKPEDDDLGLLAMSIHKYLIENELRLRMDQNCDLPTFSWHPPLTQRHSSSWCYSASSTVVMPLTLLHTWLRLTAIIAIDQLRSCGGVRS